MGSRRCTAFLLALVLVLQPFQFALSQSAGQKVVVRNSSEASPGIYVSSCHDALRAVKVADLNVGSIKEYFNSHPSLESEVIGYDLETGAPLDINLASKDRSKFGIGHDQKILYVVGVPMFGKEKAEVMGLVKSLLKDAKLKRAPQVRAITQPKGRWKLLQRFLYPAPLAQDWVEPSPAEIKQGIDSVTISSSIGFTVQIFAHLATQAATSGWENVAWQQAAIIVVPAAVINLAQSAAMSLPRPFWQNYFRRAESIAAPVVTPLLGESEFAHKVSRVMGSVAQQIWLTVFFTFNIYWAGSGSLDAALANFTAGGLMAFGMSKWNSMIMNMWWRTPAENSLADYVDRETKLGRPGEAAKEAAYLRKIMTIVATNFWVYSTLTTISEKMAVAKAEAEGTATHFATNFVSPSVEFLGAKWNLGHAGMFAIGIFGMAAWLYPEIHKWMYPRVQKFFHPIGKVGEPLMMPLRFLFHPFLVPFRFALSSEERRRFKEKWGWKSHDPLLETEPDSNSTP